MEWLLITICIVAFSSVICGAYNRTEQNQKLDYLTKQVDDLRDQVKTQYGCITDDIRYARDSIKSDIKCRR